MRSVRSGPTLREIARSADVSIASVSYVLNGKPGISDLKRREIQRLLAKSGLKPKHLRHPAFYICRESEFNNLAIFAPFFQKYKGLNSGFHDQNASMRLEFINDGPGRDLNAQLQELASYKPGAVVLDSNLGEALPHTAEFFQSKRVPVMQIGHTVLFPGADAVIVDDFSGAYAGTKHLISRGHTKIATIRWAVSRDSASSKKHAGFLCAMQEAGLEVAPEYVVESPFKRKELELPGRVAIEQLVNLPDPPTAVFVENSFVSAPMLYPIDGSEHELPAKIAALDMVHFEAWNLDFVEQVMNGILRYNERRTKLVQIDWQQMGWVAAKRLVDRMSGEQREPEVIRLAPRLVEVKGAATTPL